MTNSERRLPSPFVAALLLLLLAPGCAWMRWNQRGEMTAFGPKVPCRVPPHATAEELVEHLNQNVDKLHAWHAGRVRLRANNLPTLNAMIAVEKNRHLRIMVSSLAGDEMDLGCNEDVFWFWAKRNPQPAVMYANHEQLDLVRETLQIPFEPDWLLEALGVAAIPLEGTTLEPVNERTSRLVSQHVSPQGRRIRKAITVDTCHGRVLEQSVWSESGHRIAHAKFSNHRLDPATGVVLAHHIQLEWPQAEISLAMDLGQVEVNPANLPQKIWEMPHMPGYPVMNLEDVALDRHGTPRRPSPVSQEPAASRRVRDDLWQARRELEQDEPLDLDAEEAMDDSEAGSSFE